MGDSSSSSSVNINNNMFVVFLIPFFVLDVVIYVLSFGWLSKWLKKKGLRMQSIQHGEATATRGACRRSAIQSDELVKGDFDTLYEMTQTSIRKYADKTAMTWRHFIEYRKVKETDRFPTKIFDDADLHTLTYRELGNRIGDFGAGLRAIGMEPIPQLADADDAFDRAKGKFVMVIFEDTCSNWTVAVQGAFTQSVTVATCYATLGIDAVIAAVNETGATTLFTNWKNADRFVALADKMPTLETVVASTHELPDGATVPGPDAPSSKIRVVTDTELMRLGSAKKIQHTPPKGSDVAVIMYTSGSTGAPKGVVMRHSQVVAGVSGMKMNLDIGSDEVFVSYLPLAHILALQVEIGMIWLGCKLCYSDPRQINQTLPLFRPTVFAGVPKVYDLLRQGIEKQLSKAPMVQSIFDTMMTWKRHMLRAGMDTPVSNLFFKAITKKLFGGILNFAVTGGGPISSALHEFCRALFCCPVIQGYALTETCVGGCFQNLADTRSSVVGPPVPCVEIALQSEPDIKDSAGLPYLHTDRVGSKGEPVLGRGEICIRGPCVSSGYYKLPDKTKEEYDSEGFFHTGDIGQFTADGVIEIIDRKKNLVKLRGGEYVAVESMESAFAQTPFANGLCVVASGALDTPLAIVNGDRSYLKKWATQNDIKYNSLEDLAQKDVTRKAVVKSMVDAGKEAGLTSLELRIKDCCLIVDREWGPGEGFTASMKIDRKQIFSMHKKELDEMLKRNGVDASQL